jgi:hypothetical protein
MPLHLPIDAPFGECQQWVDSRHCGTAKKAAAPHEWSICWKGPTKSEMAL